MSVNQGRIKKSEAQQQLRKTGRTGGGFGGNRGISGGGKGGAAAPPPLSSSSSSSSSAHPALSANRSFKKSGNVQAGQSWANQPSWGFEEVAAPVAIQNGTHVQPTLHGSSNMPPNGGKLVDSSNQRSSRPVPRPPPSQYAAGQSDSTAPLTPAKGDASRSFLVQFGTINPGMMNGMQVPARTSSAPPNLDEQKRAQAHQAVPALPIQPAPKQRPPEPHWQLQQQQQLPLRKDVVGVSQVNTVDSHPPTQEKRDVHPQTPAAPTALPPRPFGLPMSGISTPMSFQLQQIPVPFGGPVPQMQSQGLASSSLQMTMTLPVGGAPQVPQQMFVPGHQSHPLQPQAMLHQGQGLGFAPPMAHQLTPQLGNMGIGISAPQFSQQHPGKFGGPRKTTAVKITHPETHEELRLSKRTDSHSEGGTLGQRTLPNLNPQAQPVPSFTPSHQMTYFPQLQPTSYNPSTLFYPTSTSHPLTSTQMITASQVPKYSYSVGKNGQPISFMSHSTANPMPGGKSVPSFHSVPELVNSIPVSAPSTSVQVTVKPAVGSLGDKVSAPSVTVSMPSTKAETSKSLKPSGEAPPSHQQRDSKISLEGSVQRPKLVTESSVGPSLSIADRHPTAVTPAVSMERVLLGTTSASIFSAGDCGAVAEGTDGRRKEPIQRLNSLKGEEKKLNKNDIEHSHQENQTGASDPADGFKSSNEITSEDMTTRQVSKDSEGIQGLLGEDVSSSATSLPSPSAEHTISSVKTSEAVESKTVPSASGPSGVILEKEAPQDVPCACQDALEVANATGISIEHRIVTSTLTSGHDVGASKSKILSSASCLDGQISIEHRIVTSTLTSGHDVGASKSKILSSASCLDGQISPEILEKREMVVADESGRTEVSDDSSQDSTNAEEYPVSTGSESSYDAKQAVFVKQEGSEPDNSDKPVFCESHSGEGQLFNTYKETEDNSAEADKKAEEIGSIDTNLLDIIKEDVSSSTLDENKVSLKDVIAEESETLCGQDSISSDPSVCPQGTAAVPSPDTSETKPKLEGKVIDLFIAPVTSETTWKPEGKVMDWSGTQSISIIPFASKEKSSLDPARAKTVTAKKKRRAILSKADAAGASDLYNAYKGPEEKHKTSSAIETLESCLPAEKLKSVAQDDSVKDVAATEEDEQSKAEVDDWEDAADISTPKLKTSDEGRKISGGKNNLLDYGNETMHEKKYSRDFLLTFQVQCTGLPIGFEIGSDVVNALMSSPAAPSNVVDREPYPSPGRTTVDRSLGAPRSDRRMVGIMDDDKWTKAPGSFASGREFWMDAGHGATTVSLRPGQGINNGVLRNPRGQSSNQFSGGILSGPMPSMAPQGGIPRSGVDADRWQRAIGVQRGLMPSPQSPSQVMHKAEKKYEVGKVSDKEVKKQRELKAILNKLTPQNFEKLFQQVKDVDIDNTVTLTGVISQIFDKALMEPTFCEMYANFCFHLAGELPDFVENNVKITFKRLLLNKCQEEFERGEREQAEVDKTEEEGEVEQSEGEKEAKRIRARRRMLGNIRLIGELYKKKMLTERIMHECIQKLLGQYQNPDEEDIEALCKLMSTIGTMIDHPKAKEHMDAYFDRMQKLSTDERLSSRVRFMLLDAIELRKKKWQQRRKVEGPKKIEEVHRDAAQERQAQASRSSRGPGVSAASRRVPSVDYGLRGSSVLPSASSQQMSGARGFPPQARGYGSQDVRADDRYSSESRTLSLPLPQRPGNDDSITLGPQGGLARGMSIRGQSLVSSIPLAEIPSSSGEPRRMTSGANGYSSTPDRLPYISIEENMQRFMQDHGPYVESRDSRVSDHVFDRSTTNTSLSAGRVGGSQSALPESKPLSEEILCEKSILMIKEFYSAKDEGEVALCIKDLNSPSFYPAMVSLWVTDSFERKDKERDLLARLLVSLYKSGDQLLSQVQLVQGFESVLSTLEDAVNDAPKASEFLGCIFAKVILEGVVSLSEIGRLIREGGEEPGRLLEIGLASEVLGSTLEIIRTEKGDFDLNEIRMSSDLKLEDFRAPHPIKSKKLEAFL